MLDEVKIMLGITGTYQDNAIQGYINEVKAFLKDGGVAESVIKDSANVGLIARGVADLWNLGNGGTSLSPYFIQRAIQLSQKDEDSEDDKDE